MEEIVVAIHEVVTDPELDLLAPFVPDADHVLV